MGLTTDSNDPRLGHGVDDSPRPQQEAYLVLSEEERGKSFVRPLRLSYKHIDCGNVTSMARGIAETYARQPDFYGATYCTTCRCHLPVEDFIWIENDGLPHGQKVGS